MGGTLINICSFYLDPIFLGTQRAVTICALPSNVTLILFRRTNRASPKICFSVILSTTEVVGYELSYLERFDSVVLEDSLRSSIPFLFLSMNISQLSVLLELLPFGLAG